MRRHRIRLSLYFAFPVSFGALWAIPANSSLLVWGFFAPFLFPLYFFLSEYRQEHHLTWWQTIGRFAGWCFIFGSLGLALVGFVELAAGMTPYWHIVLPILLVVGLYAAYLGLSLLVLYFAVRVVRAAWKRPMSDPPVTRQELESVVEEILERHHLSEDDDFDDEPHDTALEDETGYDPKEHRHPCDRCGEEQAEDDLYPGGYRRRICRKCWHTEGDELAALAQAVESQRGYADFFDWPDKRQKELGILATFAEAFRKAGGSIVGEHLTERDPPDAVALSQTGAKIGIELVELVDQSLVERQKRNPERAQWRAWSREDLREALRAKVARKDRAQALVHDLSEYWVVVHTGNRP